MAIAPFLSWVSSCFNLVSGRPRGTGPLSNGGPSSSVCSSSRRLPSSCSNLALASTFSTGWQTSLPTFLTKVSSALPSFLTQTLSTQSTGSLSTWYVFLATWDHNGIPCFSHPPPSSIVVRHHNLLQRIGAGAVSLRRHAVGHQELCVVLFQGHERVRCRSRRRVCFSVRRSG